ncbi:MAG TPA: phosphodiester glycosidase family protein [Chitinophagaceae bacterium]|jgi:hypothetical protein|nr:phosphodiester glycosidase family protein [Chitinophagaceae bacterium]
MASLRFLFSIVILFSVFPASGQLGWILVDSAYGPLPEGVHLYRSADSLKGSPGIAYYLEAPLRSRRIRFTVDTTRQRRLTPSAYFERNGHPWVVVNATFFSLTDHRNLSTVVRNGKILARSPAVARMKTGDTTRDVRVYRGALGISRKRKADIAWVSPDSTRKRLYASQQPVAPDTSAASSGSAGSENQLSLFRHWKVKTAVGGGPVLVQNNMLMITNETERMFVGKVLLDKHPRTAIGYTADGRLIILVVQGRMPGKAEGASLPALAGLMKSLGCVEALNLDGGGSSCLLVNGKETIMPSDREGQRPVPAVFLIK